MAIHTPVNHWTAIWGRILISLSLSRSPSFTCLNWYKSLFFSWNFNLRSSLFSLSTYPLSLSPFPSLLSSTTKHGSTQHWKGFMMTSQPLATREQRGTIIFQNLLHMYLSLMVSSPCSNEDHTHYSTCFGHAYPLRPPRGRTSRPVSVADSRVPPWPSSWGSGRPRESCAAFSLLFPHTPRAHSHSVLFQPLHYTEVYGGSQFTSIKDGKNISCYAI